MPIVRVDLSQIRSTALTMMPTRADAIRLLRGVSAVARQRWVSLAQQGLRTTGRDYVAGIQPVECDDRTARVVLLGVMPNLVENGMAAFDLRTTLLGMGAKNAKTAKDGSRYNTVPFGHGSPGSSGRNVGAAMPKSIHDVAKKLAPSLSRPGGGTQWGGRLSLGMPMSRAARSILERKEKPWHWGSTYLGMVRQEKRYAQATQSKYTTFRRISNNVKRGKEHWLHPGITARRYVQRVQAEMGKIVESVFANTLSPSAGGGKSKR